jgi:hypothetical protein
MCCAYTYTHVGCIPDIALKPQNGGVHHRDRMLLNHLVLDVFFFFFFFGILLSMKICKILPYVWLDCDAILFCRLCHLFYPSRVEGFGFLDILSVSLKLAALSIVPPLAREL